MASSNGSSYVSAGRIVTRNNPNLVSETIDSNPLQPPNNKCCKFSNICHAGNAENFVMLYLFSFINPHKFCLKISLGCYLLALGKTSLEQFSLISGPKVQLSQRSMITPKPCSGIASDNSMGMGRLKNRFFQMKVKDPHSRHHILHISILEILETNLQNYNTSFILEDRFAKRSHGRQKLMVMGFSSAAPSPSVVFFCFAGGFLNLYPSWHGNTFT